MAGDPILDLILDFDIDTSAYTVNLGGASQLWTGFVQDSSFQPSDFAGTEWWQTPPASLDPGQALTGGISIDPATQAVYDQAGSPIVGGEVMAQVLAEITSLKEKIAALDTTQAKAGVRPEARTVPGWLAAQVYDLKRWLSPLVGQLGGGGTTPKASSGGKFWDLVLGTIVAGASIGIAQALRDDDEQLVVPESRPAPITAAGNQAVLNALTTRPGGTVTGAGTGAASGTTAAATGMENLERAIAAALSGQRDLAEYYAAAAKEEIRMAQTALAAMPAYLNPTPATLTAAGDPVSAGLLERLTNVFAGQASNPVLAKAIAEAKDRTHNLAMAGRPAGTGEAGDSRTIELNRARDFNEAALLDADYKQSVAQLVPLYNQALTQNLARLGAFANPSQGPLSSIASIPVLSGVSSADQAAAAQANREFMAALESVKASAAAGGALPKSVSDIGMLLAAGTMFGRG